MRKSPSSGVLAFLLLAMIAMKPAASQEKAAYPAQKPQLAAKQSSQLPRLTLTPATASVLPNQTISFQLIWEADDRYATTGQFTNQFIYEFNWGDGQISNVVGIATASHSYSSQGNYTVRVTARPNPKLQIAEEQRNVFIQSTPAEITVRSPAQSKVALISDKTNLTVGDTVTFSAIVNPPMPGAQFQFDFGDGPEQTTGSNQITHIYTVASTYNPMVIVLTKGARESAKGSPITVSAPPVEQTGVPNQAPQAINFTQPLSPLTYSSGLQISLSATGGASGNPVVFSIDGSSTATGSISGSTLTVTSPGILVIDANQAGNDSYSAAPQVQRTIMVNAPVPVPVPASPLWIWIAAGAAGASAVGIILWLIFRKKPPPDDQSSPLPPDQTRPQASKQSFRYVANEGSASYQIKFKQPSRPLGSITLTPGMDQAEYTIEFPGKAGVSRPGRTS
jgi:hypothetical protein